MSDVVKPLKKIARKVHKISRKGSPSAQFFGNSFDQFDIVGQRLGTSKGIFNPAVPEAGPGVPTIDDARIAQDAFDRIRRRRGTLANIFGGGSRSQFQPIVSQKALLGS